MTMHIQVMTKQTTISKSQTQISSQQFKDSAISSSRLFSPVAASKSSVRQSMKSACSDSEKTTVENGKSSNTSPVGPTIITVSVTTALFPIQKLKKIWSIFITANTVPTELQQSCSLPSPSVRWKASCCHSSRRFKIKIWRRSIIRPISRRRK